MKTKIILTSRCLSVIVMSIIFILPGCKKVQPPPPIEVMVVQTENRDVPVAKEWVGQVFGAVNIEIRARTRGWITGMHFKEGSEVKKGTLLYTIDDSEVRQSVVEAQGNLAKAQTLLVQAEEDVKRYRPLAEAGAVSKRELEAALARYGARKGEVDAASAALELAKVNLGYSKIYAPISGLIGISAARMGEYVGNPPNPIIINTISNIDTVNVRFSISESEYLYLMREVVSKKDRKQVELDLILSDGSMYTEKGRVSFADRNIDPATGTLRFEASYPNYGHILRPGQFAKVRAVVDTKKNAIVVPSRSLVEIQGRFLVYVVNKEDKVELKYVKTGTTYGALTMIEEGINTGEMVIIEGVQKVKPDMKVKPSLVAMPSDKTAVENPGAEGN